MLRLAENVPGRRVNDGERAAGQITRALLGYEADRDAREADKTAENAGLIALSVSGSCRRIAAALSIGCPQCGAAEGVQCFEHGFCGLRWAKAVELSIPAPVAESKATAGRYGDRREVEFRHRNRRHEVRASKGAQL